MQNNFPTYLKQINGIFQFQNKSYWTKRQKSIMYNNTVFCGAVIEIVLQ